MRLPLLLCVFVLSLLFISPLRAEEEPTPPVAPEKPAAEEAAPADEPEEPEPSVETLATPRAAYAEIQQQMRKAPRATRTSMAREAAKAYLEKYAASGATATGSDAIYVGRLQGLAGDAASAASTFLAVIEAEECAERDRVMATSQLASILGSTTSRTALEEAGHADKVSAVVREQVAKPTSDEVKPTVAQAHMMLANYLTAKKDMRGAVAHRMKGAQKNPALAYSAARSVVGTLKGSTHDMAGYAPLQMAGAALLASLEELANAHVASIEARITAAEEGNASDAAKRNLTSQLSRAKRSRDRIPTMQAGLDLLGTPAPDWTLVHPYGDLKSIDELKGKVVVLDFWATWCPWCIKSFPAIRDLLRDYKDQDLVVVGVTASASTVYDQRYGLDDDLGEKAEEHGSSSRAVARRARAGQEPNAEKRILDAASYETVERETIQKFIANHEMTWPVVMIDAKEPGPKYALSGWPHAVVIDRQGRVRYLKAGALLRDRKEQVAAFRKVLDDLLAEGAQ